MAIKITGPIGAGGGGVSGVSSVNGATGVVNLYADNATLNLAGDGLTVSGAGATSTLTVDDASTTAAGKVELADNTEAAAASATDKALTPSNIGSIETADLNNTAGFISDITNESLNDLNDVSYTAGAGIDNYVLTYDHSTTSWGAEAAPTAAAASTTTAGIVELADNTEAAAASATDKALTPSNIGSIDTSDLNNDAGFIADITGESLNDLSDVSYTAGAGIDNYVLTYDHSTTSWGAEAAPTAAAASTTVAGIVELADNTEAAAASATDKALTPSNIGSIETGDLNNTAGFIADITNESLNDLSDVSYTAGAGIDNYVLTYDHGTTSWGAEAAPTAAAASTTVAGVVELADNTEAAAASATDRALTPSNIPSIETGDLNNTAGFIADITNESLNDLNDVSYTAGVGIDNYVLTYDHSTTSWGAEAAPTAAAASTTVAGIVELADNTEAAAASATDRALTPANIGSIDTSDLNNDAGFIADITGESLNDLNDVSYTAGAGIDNYVLTYDHGTTSWGAEAAPTAAAASTTVAGIVELADNTEAAAASATDRALTPSNIPSIETGDLNNTAGFISDITNESLNDLSDVSYTAGAGIDNYVLTYDHSTTSWGAEAAPTAAAASTTVAGIVELADNTEAAAASATDRALTPSNIGSIDTSDLNNDAGFISDVLSDSSPQLGGNLDIQARIIETSTANGSIGLEPDGTGTVIARGTGAGNTPGTVTLNCEQNSHGVALQSPPHSAAASYTLKLPTGVGTSGQLLTTDGNNPAQLSWSTVSGGGGSRPVVYSVSTSTTIGADTAIASTELERIYVVDTTSAVTMTLPQITGNVGNGYKLNIKRSGANTCTITPNAADNIDGGTDGASITLDVDKSAYTLVCDGTNWQII